MSNMDKRLAMIEAQIIDGHYAIGDVDGHWLIETVRTFRDGSQAIASCLDVTHQIAHDLAADPDCEGFEKKCTEYGVAIEEARAILKKILP